MIFIFQIIAVFSLIWSQRQDFNLRPAAYKTAALSTELHWHICTGCILRAFPIKLYFTLVKHLDSNQKLGFIRAKKYCWKHPWRLLMAIGASKENRTLVLSLEGWYTNRCTTDANNWEPGWWITILFQWVAVCSLCIGGCGRIWTHEPFLTTDFQDQGFQPLSHTSI